MGGLPQGHRVRDPRPLPPADPELQRRHPGHGGRWVNLTGFNFEVLFLSAIIIIVAVVTKLIGCGLPAIVFFRNKSKAMKVGIGMISRGEVGLIVAGIGVTTGALSSNIYTTVIIMVAVTTIITPIWLKKAYHNELMASAD